MSLFVTLLFVVSSVILRVRWQIGADRCLEFPRWAEPLSTGPLRNSPPLPLPLLARAAVVMATEKGGWRAQVSSPPLSQVDIRLQSDVTLSSGVDSLLSHPVAGFEQSARRLEEPL